MEITHLLSLECCIYMAFMASWISQLSNYFNMHTRLVGESEAATIPTV
jgi:hypothetical protein